MSEYEYKQMELMKLLRDGNMAVLQKLEPALVRARAGKYAYAWAANGAVMRFLKKCGVLPVLGERGETPLFHCPPERVKDLVAAGYDVNHRAPDEFGELALIKATYANDVPKVQALLEYGADVTLANQYGRTAFAFAKTPQMLQVLAAARAKACLQKAQLKSLDMPVWHSARLDAFMQKRLAVPARQYD